MENPALELVRQILRSKDFLALSLDQQQATLNQVLTTGEISQQDLVRIIGEEALKSKQIGETRSLANNLEKVDYNTFLTIVLTGNIRGEKLLALCSGSPKLNEFCNRSFQLLNNQGIPTGPPESQYLFRLLLDKQGIEVPPDKTPRKVYTEKSIGGVVVGFGSNFQGELGINTRRVTFLPTEIPDFKNIIQVSAGSYYSLCLDSQGRVWSFGDNFLEQLGYLNKINNTIPRLVNFEIRITQVSAGANHSLCLDDQRRVWGFGNNHKGQLGVGDNKTTWRPRRIPKLNDIIQVSAGGYEISSSPSSHSLCLDNQGRVWGFGNNKNGELGVKGMSKTNTPTLIPNLNNIIQVSAGEEYSICVDRQGRVWGFGSNDEGRLGVGDVTKIEVPTLILGLNNIIQVSTGYYHSLYLDNKGRVWGLGNNKYHQLGFNDQSNKSFPTLIPDLINIVQVSAGGLFSLCLDNTGQVWGFGSNNSNQLALTEQQLAKGPVYTPVLNSYLSDIIYISCGNSHSLCIKKTL